MQKYQVNQKNQKHQKNFFADTFRELPDWHRLSQALQDGETPVCVTGLSAIHKAQFALTAALQQQGVLLLLTGTEAEALRLCQDINAMAGETIALHYPAKEMLFTCAESKSLEYEQERLHVLHAAALGQIRIIAAGTEACLQPTIPVPQLLDACMTLHIGDSLDLPAFRTACIAAGYTRCETVEGKGQFAVRGAIIDIFPVQEDTPFRMELFGDDIDTLSRFDPETQRRTEAVRTCVIAPACELLCPPDVLRERILTFAKQVTSQNSEEIRSQLVHDAERLDAGLQLTDIDKYYALIYPEHAAQPATVLDYVTGEILLSEFAEIRRLTQSLTAQYREDMQAYIRQGVLCRKLARYIPDAATFQELLFSHSCICLYQFLQGSEHVPFRKIISMQAMQNATWGGEIRQLLEDLQEYLSQEYRVILAAGSEKILPVLANDLQESGIRCAIADRPGQPEIAGSLQDCLPGMVLLTARHISAGFAYPENRTALIVRNRLHATNRKIRRHKPGADIRTLADLHPGDLVVHMTHGIGRFLGIHKLELEGIIKDYITIQYAGTEKLYVPVTQLDLVSRYIGGEEANVKLSRLSSPQWQKTCGNVRRMVKDMAEKLTKLYAVRENTAGFAFCPDDEIQLEFEARFPYAETDDQLRSVQEIKADMERPHPMDRLLCGDVGFGKTEVAFRAAMKCILSNKQCAMLAPTTVLAFQHYRTALQRFDQMPVRVAMLSRFCTAKEQKVILSDLEKGKIDFLIGTHRLLQKDVKFHDLGLAIIDEEQRFGVAHKERFKEIFAGIDVLTLSATPIPRTLNMALSGIRDMSVLAQPPQDRHPVQTYVTEYQESIVTQAISRELRRGGQVYYIHNRIDTILHCAERIRQAFPDARVAVAHGKLSEQEMSEIWQQVSEGETDILVCTTIIETGVDVPNVNTLLIEDADCFGLSQLYQLRGRVGRSDRRAYAYFLFRRDKILSELAARRLEAMREFTQFGSGFRIAMRDLELRGAGSILNSQQHGHIETVGYDMYMQMLQEAIAECRGEPVPAVVSCTVDIQMQAYIPETYIRSNASRIAIYRKIAAVRDEQDESELLDELIDRYGDPPDSVTGLLRISLLRNRASALGITEITQRHASVQFYIAAPTPEQIAALSARYGRRILFDCTARPHIDVKLISGQSPAKLIQEMLQVMQEAVISGADTGFENF